MRLAQYSNSGCLTRPGRGGYERQPAAYGSVVDPLKQAGTLKERAADMRWMEFGVRKPMIVCQARHGGILAMICNDYSRNRARHRFLFLTRVGKTRTRHVLA